VPPERIVHAMGRHERKHFYAAGEHFFLENLSRGADTIHTTARGQMSERPQRPFFGMQIVLEFTLPMLVIRNYVLEPE